MLKIIDGVGLVQFENLAASGMVRHCVTTRIGGVSPPPYDSLNMGLSTGDARENVLENIRRLSGVCGWKMENIAISHQMHDADIRNMSIADMGKGIFREQDYQNIDGMVTSDKNLVLMTYYADCVPLLFLDARRGAIACVHAGWRGTLANIGGAAIAKMAAEFNSDPADILVGIGPSISAKNFQVGPDVYEEFIYQLPFAGDFMYNDFGDRRRLDLWGINRRLLEDAGVDPANIEISGFCTYEREDLFFSHRRDGAARGSIAALIELI